MAQPLACHLRMNARGQHVSGMGVPQIVNSNAGEGRARDDPIPIVRERVRLQRLTVFASANMGFFGRGAKPPPPRTVALSTTAAQVRQGAVAEGISHEDRSNLVGDYCVCASTEKHDQPQ